MPHLHRTFQWIFLGLFFLGGGVQAFGSDYPEKQLEVVLRQIGNRVLLTSGDTTSRVLPVTRKANTFTIQFQQPIRLNSDSLYDIVAYELQRIHISKFIAEVKNCGSEEVVLAFMYTSASDSLLPCKGRDTDPACYQLLITLPDLHQPQKASLWWWILLFPLAIALIFWQFQKRSAGPDPAAPITDPGNIPQLPRVGRYQFDPIKARLYLDGAVTALSDKESRLLELLLESRNQPLDRETLMAEIWGEKGVLVISRNIDVLVSKLRKKLADDPTIRIANVHSVGYKLEEVDANEIEFKG